MMADRQEESLYKPLVLSIVGIWRENRRIDDNIAIFYTFNSKIFP